MDKVMNRDNHEDPMISIMEACDNLTRRSAENSQSPRLSVDEINTPFGCKRDVKASRALFSNLCEVAVENARFSGATNRRPTMQSGSMLRSVDAPPKAIEFFEATSKGEPVDIRIFGLDRNDADLGTYITAAVIRLSENQDPVLVPYGFNRWNETSTAFIFDDGHSEKKYVVANESTARQLWESEVPVRLRSANTIVRTERSARVAIDADGPYLVETDRGTVRKDSLVEALTWVSDKASCAFYKIMDAKNETVIASATAQTTTPESITADLISEAAKRGAAIIRITPTAGSKLSGGSVTVECTDKVQINETLAMTIPGGARLIVNVIDAGQTMVIAEACREDEAHIDQIRSARKVVVKLVDGKINAGGSTKFLINDNVTVVDGAGSYSGLNGVVTEAILDDSGFPKAMGKKREFDPMNESFVRLDNGDLVVIQNDKLLKA